MHIVNIHEAKTQFSKLIDSVVEGNEITIAKAHKPVAKLVPLKNIKKRVPGALKGKIKIADDFNDALPEDILVSFEGG